MWRGVGAEENIRPEKPRLEARGGEMWRRVGAEENIRPENPMRWV